MSTVNKVLMAPDGPEFSQLVQGYWRLGSWDMDAQARLTFLKQHIEMGISTVDHAAIYDAGHCETLFGEALKLDPSIREQIEIVSKFGINGIATSATEKRVSHYDSSKAGILASTENSLRRLGVEQLDALLVHRPDFLMDADQVAEAFNELKQSGKVKHFGVSNFTTSQFDLLQSRLDAPLITNQVEFNPINFDVVADGTLDQLQQHRVRPMAWSCLAGGAIFSAQTEQVKRLRATLSELGEELGADSIDQVIYAWILKHPSNPVALLGTGNIKRVKDAAAALTLKMNAEQWYRVWVASKGVNVP
ncbi:aldo/keto reductase [Psychromonas ingrahamii 37]|uniref:Aldo/keto reductase n=1 Tax=Psychromonas ingrahamii (strain DSM 17664 / CCUG 51855 / 37) TaxID=357804 RepID=A1T024_PSYIN|nr:aldo/keto reductase [Psychromonas ingrahamii]ABM05089.1 aldo/keto reductase [Psychromonas ingrahamii 37]